MKYSLSDFPHENSVLCVLSPKPPYEKSYNDGKEDAKVKLCTKHHCRYIYDLHIHVQTNKLAKLTKTI